MPLPTIPGPNIVDIKENLDELYEIDKLVFNKPPILLPFETKEELFYYLAIKHKTTTLIWNNDKGEVVGYLSYEEDKKVPSIVELINIGTLPQFRVMGYGKKMMEHYHALFKEKDFKLVTHPDNVASKSLYEKMGYRPVKIIENYFGDGEPRLLFFKQAED